MEVVGPTRDFVIVCKAGEVRAVWFFSGSVFEHL